MLDRMHTFDFASLAMISCVILSAQKKRVRTFEWNTYMVLAALARVLPQRPNSNMTLQEVTLERLSKNNIKYVVLLLRPVYHEMKKIEAIGKKPWWKAIVRLVDKKGQGLYAEIRGSTDREVQERAKEFYGPKFVQVTELEVKQNSTFLAGFSADVTRKGKVSALPEAHPSVAPLRAMFPVAKSNFGLLKKHCQGYERADVIGKVTLKETPPTKVPKVTLWLKDESRLEVAINLWGNRLTKQAESVQQGDVVQVDNALLSRKIDGSVEASAEHWMDSVKNMFAALHIKPVEERVTALKELSDDRGEAVSTPWLQTGAHRLASDGLEKFISCCATVAACSLSSSSEEKEARRCSCFVLFRGESYPCLQLHFVTVSCPLRHKTPSSRYS